MDAHCKWNNQVIATTIGQSEQLIKAGINPYSGDMVWWPINYLAGQLMDLKVHEPKTRLCEQAVPAWSLGALLDMLPNEIIKENGDEWAMNFSKDSDCEYCVFYYDQEQRMIVDDFCFYGDTLTAACVTMIVKLKQEDLI